ncbi:MAG TPA: hypothetical protein PKD64_04595 [Pirellulaceae bacterium]|nr:hypothetical protein [Pirellulaceae bacterium]HMO91452.1 hypothetical protein [Pirellulaceae bacterium]HMP69471.1 hypothetical protein [Pirellulaceae bacterium]
MQDKRFVILRHQFPPGSSRTDHYDVMLEADGSLRVWEVSDWPIVEERAIAAKLPDHRLAYLEYEGPISGGRGWVTRVDGGLCQRIDPQGSGLAWRLLSSQLDGTISFIQMDQEDHRWWVTWSPTVA